MTQTVRKDKAPESPREDEDVEETTRELVEALASAYFNACRKIARVLNRADSSRR